LAKENREKYGKEAKWTASFDNFPTTQWLKRRGENSFKILTFSFKNSNFESISEFGFSFNSLKFNSISLTFEPADCSSTLHRFL